MVEHKCPLCNKIFNKKSHLTDHLNRKKRCNTKLVMNEKYDEKDRKNNGKIIHKSDNKNIKNDNTCPYCNKIFSTKGNTIKHIFQGYLMPDTVSR